MRRNPSPARAPTRCNICTISATCSATTGSSSTIISPAARSPSSTISEPRILTTNYVQSQVIAEAEPIGPPLSFNQLSSDAIAPDKAPPVQTFPLAQTERYAVLRYNGDPTSHIHYSVAAYDSDFSTFGKSFDPRAGFVWTPTGNTAVRASVGTTFQTPQLSELARAAPGRARPGRRRHLYRQPEPSGPTAQPISISAWSRSSANPNAPLHLGTDLYQTNLRAPSSQTNPVPIPHCQTQRNPTPCPISMPVNAGNGVYRGIDIHADQQLGDRPASARGLGRRQFVSHRYPGLLFKTERSLPVSSRSASPCTRPMSRSARSRRTVLLTVPSSITRAGTTS